MRILPIEEEIIERMIHYMGNIREEIKKDLEELCDRDYANFQRRIITTAAPESIIGVCTPDLRGLAKGYAERGDCLEFLSSLPHTYFEENQLHALLLSLEKDFEVCVQEIEKFLPYIDNWATCDQLSPKVFKKQPEKLLPYMDHWLDSGLTYTVRFGIKMLMDHFLNEKFDLIYPERVAQLRSEEYYVNMMIAWYFATALAKQYEQILPFIEEQRLDIWTHNKTIQKAVESYRITQEQKEYLKTLKRKRK